MQSNVVPCRETTFTPLPGGNNGSSIWKPHYNGNYYWSFCCNPQP
jgi:hypothetical protein